MTSRNRSGSKPDSTPRPATQAHAAQSTKPQPAPLPPPLSGKKPSPGRYSLGDGSTEMPAVRIESTRSMAAVRPPDSSGTVAKETRSTPPPAAAPSEAAPASDGVVVEATEVEVDAAEVDEAEAAALAAEAEHSEAPHSKRSTQTQKPPPNGVPGPGFFEPIKRTAAFVSKGPVKPGPGRAGLRNAQQAQSPESVQDTPTTEKRSEVPPPPRSSSLRPPPPPKRESRPAPALDIDEGSIADAFDALLSEGTSGLEGKHSVDLAPVRELFSALAANHMRHVRDFMIDVKWGEATRDWIAVCVPAVSSLRRAAERLAIEELSVALEELRTSLESTALGGSPTIDGEARGHLLDVYERCVALMPEAFALDRDRTQREAVIVQALLLSVPDVRKVTIDKLHAAGLMSLELLFGAQAEEIAEVAGIQEALAARIVARFQAYRQEMQNASPSDARAAEREKLATLATTLEEHHLAFEEASQGWSSEAKAKKRDCFRAREDTWLEISLLLARFGEVDTLRGIEKVPFAQRIEQLSAWLADAADRYRASPE